MRKSDTFKFQLFEVKQLHSAMKVGTDGVILGSWVTIQSLDRRILDIGTGTGLLALMVAQKAAAIGLSTNIDAVEIEHLAAQEAEFNAANSPWHDHIKVHECSIQEYAYATSCARECYDLVISNPPYFVDSSLSTQAARTAARHAALLPYDDLIDSVKLILDPTHGRFVAIFPAQEAGIFIAKAAAKGLFCNKRLNIHPMPMRITKRIAAEFSFTPNSATAPEQSLTITEGIDQPYTQQYIDLCRDFYIRF